MQTETNERHTVDEHEAAKALGISVHTLRKDRVQSRRIPFYRIGTSVRYDMLRVWQALEALEVGGMKPANRAAR
jgi:excisionase family DNA binding protein